MGKGNTCLFAVFQTTVRNIDPAQYNREHVVKIMGNTASQLPDRFHLLRLPKLAFRRLACFHLSAQFANRIGQFVIGLPQSALCET